MTERNAEHILRLLDEIRDAIVEEAGSEKEHSPAPPRMDNEERRHDDRRTDKPLQTTLEVATESNRVLNDAAARDETKQPPGKTFKRVRVITETEVTTKVKKE